MFSTRCGTVSCRDYGCPRCCAATTSSGEELTGPHRVGIGAAFAALARHQRATSTCRGRQRR